MNPKKTSVELILFGLGGIVLSAIVGYTSTLITTGFQVWLMVASFLFFLGGIVMFIIGMIIRYE